MSDVDRYEKLYTPEAEAVLRLDQGARPPEAYLQGLRRSFAGKPLLSIAARAAAEVEPYNSNGEKLDRELVASSAFLKGTLPAIRLAYAYLSKGQRLEIARHDIRIAKADASRGDFAEVQKASYKAHMALAREGWQNKAPAFRGLFGQWSRSMSLDAREVMCFENGFGFMMQVFSNVEDTIKRSEIDQLAKDSAQLDWDAGVANELMAPPGTTHEE